LKHVYCFCWAIHFVIEVATVWIQVLCSFVIVHRWNCPALKLSLGCLKFSITRYTRCCVTSISTDPGFSAYSFIFFLIKNNDESEFNIVLNLHWLVILQLIVILPLCFCRFSLPVKRLKTLMINTGLYGQRR